jgi:hypothetical protein
MAATTRWTDDERSAEMSDRTRRSGAAICALALGIGWALLAPPAGAATFTRDFRIESCTWSAWGRENTWFSLRPGRQLVLEGEEDGTEIRAEVTNLHQLETIQFVTPRGASITVVARVLEEREFEDGVLVEVSRNWVARCVETGNIFYFGEEVDNYEDGVLVDHEGAWRAGVDGAQPGVLMPGTFLLGSRYYQEFAPGQAEDRAEQVAMGLGVAVPAGTFGGCVRIHETDPLASNPDAADVKVHCPNVGIVRDEVLELVEVNIIPAP